MTRRSERSHGTVLIVTSAGDAHTGLVRPLLDAAGARTAVLHTDALGSSCAVHVRSRRGRLEATIELAGEVLDGHDVDAVWWRRPGPPPDPLAALEPGARRFAEQEWTRFIQGALRLLDCRWVSHPDAIRAAGYKLVQLARAAALGFRVPDTYAGASAEVRKRCDVRVTVVGDALHPATIESQGDALTEVDWRRADPYTLPHERARLPDDVARRCLALTRTFGLRFAAIDLVSTPDGDHVFLELNPNGQCGWIQELTGLPIAESLCAELTGS